MSEASIPPAVSGGDPARLALASEALDRYRTLCFWYLSPDFTVTEETLHLVIGGLRNYGDRAAFQIAARLCR